MSEEGAVQPAQFFTEHALEEYPTDNGPAYYALCTDGKVVSIAEFKKVGSSPRNVRSQAERYARGLPDNGFNSRVAFQGNERRTR